MTVAESELMKQASEKGRSASFCVPAQQQLQQQHSNSNLEGSHSTQDLSSPEQEQNMPSAAHKLLLHDLIQASESCGSAGNSPKARLKAAQNARRSQSCRVPSSKNSSRPRVRRRVRGDEHRSSTGSGKGSGANLASGGAEAVTADDQRNDEGDSYNPFLRKVPSCGRLLALAPEDCVYVQDEITGEESPVPLRRSASARRPTARHGFSDSPVDHSPTPPRQPRHQPRHKSSGSTRRASTRRAGGGLLEVRDPNECQATSPETLDSDQYLLRNFSTTHKGKNI